MANVNKLKKLLEEKEITYEILSDRLNIDCSILRKKLDSDNVCFTVEEADVIVKMLELNVETATEIFFPKCIINEI